MGKVTSIRGGLNRPQHVVAQSTLPVDFMKDEYESRCFYSLQKALHMKLDGLLG